jgi:hypothetical protein
MEAVMRARWIRKLAAVVMVTLMPDATFAAQGQPRWVMKTDAGSTVNVTMKTGESFDAIWMGPDGDRAVFQRLYPDETFSVPIDSVRGVRTIRGQSVTNVNPYGSLGAAVGFWGALALLQLMLPRT